MEMAKADESASVTHSRAAHEATTTGEKTERKKKKKIRSHWIVNNDLPVLKFTRFDIPLSPLSRAYTHVGTRVHKIFFSSVGLRLDGEPQPFTNTNTMDVYHHHRWWMDVRGVRAPCGMERSRINSVDIDFDLNSKCTHTQLAGDLSRFRSGWMCFCSHLLIDSKS